MKSSSELFPVALVRAETVGENLIEDTYLLKPNNSPDLSVEIAVTRVGIYEKAATGRPIVFLHGSFSNRGFWLSSKGIGLASELALAGYDPWMIDMRGHGHSPVNQTYSKNNVESYARYDLPAVQAFIHEQTGQKAVWVGHSLGGVSIVTALAGEHLNQALMSGLVLFGTQTRRYPVALRLPFLRLAARIALQFKSHLPGKNIGPENEPIGIAKEFVRWAGLLHGWRPKKGAPYWRNLNSIQIPALGFGAKIDKGDPAKYCQAMIAAFAGEKQYHYLAQSEGFQIDYNHVSMVVSKNAREEVWPIVSKWVSGLD